MSSYYLTLFIVGTVTAVIVTYFALKSRKHVAN